MLLFCEKGCLLCGWAAFFVASAVPKGVVYSWALVRHALPGGPSFASPKEAKCDLRETKVSLKDLFL